MGMGHAGHLFRLAATFVVGTGLFLALRAAYVPHSFGQYGHYRGDSIQEVAALPVVHAGHEQCEACHSDIATVKQNGKHVTVNCEACHGALGKHAEDPSSVVPQKPDAAVLCARCHEASSSKPKWFKQVDTAQHSGGAPCNACHNPHTPVIGSDTPDTKGAKK